MDLQALREAAIEATSRALHDKLGFVPSDESDEWEDEYRRQFALLKQRFATEAPVAPRVPAAPAAVERQWPELSGTPEQKRWAATIREERLREMVDASDRFDLAPLTVKLAEIAVEGRHLRIFETSDPNLLLVKEKKGPLHEDYAIERDEGLVGDLKLYAQAP